MKIKTIIIEFVIQFICGKQSCVINSRPGQNEHHLLLQKYIQRTKKHEKKCRKVIFDLSLFEI